MSKIEVTPQEMIQITTQVEKKITDWQKAVQDLMKLKTDMDAMWDGSANDSFNERFDSDMQKFNNLSGMMTEYNNAVKTAANEYINGENEVKTIVSRI